MPVSWQSGQTAAPERSGAAFIEDGDAPFARLEITPHRSLSPEGFAVFIAATAGMISLPLASVLGTPVLWGVLPFFCVTMAGMWWALMRNNRDRAMLEELTVWSDHMILVRRNPRGPDQDWEANPFWVSLHMRPEGGPVENYLTLKGGGREVEIGAFLSPDERLALRDGIAALLEMARRPDHEIGRPVT